MSLPRSQAITLKEFLSLHPPDASTVSTQSILHNDKQTEQSLNNQQTPLWSQNLIQSINQYLLPNVEHTPSTSTLQSQNKPTFVNNNSSINHSYNKERMYSIPHEITNSSIKPTISNYTNRQQLKRSNTVGITDVTKTMQRKLLMNYATNKVNDHIPIDELLCTPRQYNQLSTQLTNLINSSNDTTYNELSDISHKQRFFSRAQSEHPIRSNNNNMNCPLYSRNNTSSTFRSVFSQRGLNLGKSIWQKNFISDQYEPKTTLGSSDNSQMSTTSYLSQRDRLRKEFTVDDALIMDIKGSHSIKNNSSISSICSGSGNNNSHYINGSLIQSSISSELPPSGLSLVTSMTTTATTTTTISSTTVLSTGTNFNLNRLSTDQSVVKDLWDRKYVEEFLKKSLSTTSTNKLLNIHNEPVHLSSSFSGQTLVQWFCRQIIQSGCSWSHGLISVVCQLCNCLLQLGVLKRDPKSKVINSTTTDKRLFGHYSSDSDENYSSTALSTEIFELSMNYVWSGYNECQNTTTDTLMNGNNEQLQLNQKQQQQQQPTSESKHFQMAINNHLTNLHKEFEYELDRVTREHELQLFKVKNQGVMKVCQLTDRIEALENQVEKYRILAGIEHLTKSSMLDETLPINNNLLRNHYSPLITNKNRLSKVTFNLPNENLLNHFSRRIRASSETSNVNHFIDNIYNKPDYIKSLNVDNLQSSTSSHHYNHYEQQQQQHQQQQQQNHHQEQQQQQQQQHQNYQEKQQPQPQHSRSDSINLRRTYEISHLKNLLQKSDSLKIHQKENFTKMNRTDLGFLSFDDDTTNEYSNDDPIVDNVNKVNNNSSIQQQHENSMTRSLKNDDNSQMHQNTHSRYSTSRFISAPPHSKLNLWQTTSTSNVPPILGFQAKYDINNKLTTTAATTLKTSMKEDDNSMKTKDIKLTDKNKELT